MDMGRQRVKTHVNDMREPGLPITPKQLVTVTIPPLAASTLLIAGYDHRDGSLRVFDVGALAEQQALAEAVHILGKLDTRNTVTATIAAGSAVGSTQTATITVPSGEVWLIQALQMITPAQTVGDIVQGNIRISRWPDIAATPDPAGQAFWAANLGTGVGPPGDTYDAEFGMSANWLPFGNALPSIYGLRLEAGDIITLVATLTGAVAGGALATTLTPFGFKGKLLLA